ncbi:MAG: hypothetical protein CYPHOPRED_000306 [Cyphobasidiales sp. Tagirdzhanova-0007]|nr:MAG: hypothetical protein CYPHOPRED_000306 [Cyphobasidiales sp. Tagirdzhanova-0007]
MTAQIVYVGFSADIANPLEHTTATALFFQLLAVVVFAAFSQLLGGANAFTYGTDKIRGVNLGVESYLTPSIFAATNDASVVDEWTYGTKYGSTAAASRLQSHWDTYITENDFATIQSYGLNHVRIPIGYWSINKNTSEPFAVGAYPYITKAVQWAQKYGIKVIIDLHGAPGSQNGFDKQAVSSLGSVGWQTSSVNIQRTRDALVQITNDFAINPTYSDTVTSIELLNEPAGYVGSDFLATTKQFYYDGYGQSRYPYGNSTQSSTLITIHDAFQPWYYWSGFMSPPQWQNVALDTHFYTMFSAEQARWNYSQHIQSACDQKSSIISSNQNLWTFVGEFAATSTDCSGSKALLAANGGSYYDGTVPGSQAVGSCKGLTGNGSFFSTEYKSFMRQYWEAQVDSWEAGSGWIMWTWKTETADELSYSKGVQYGWIPKDPTERLYANPCDTSNLYNSTSSSSTILSQTVTSHASSSTTSNVTTSSKVTTSSNVTTSSKAVSTGAVGNTPMIRLKGLSEEMGCQIMGKAEFLNPGGSVKDRAALWIVKDAEAKGIGLAHTQSQEKVDLLKMLGAEVHPVPAVPYENPENYNHQAKRHAEKLENAYWTNQFDNIANRQAHIETTGPEIWSQTDDGKNLDGFTCATGTGGTLAGVTSYLKQKSNGRVKCFLADPPGSVLFGHVQSGFKEMGERKGSSITEGIGQGRVTENLKQDIHLIDNSLFIPDEASIRMVYRMLDEEGIYIGASSALNVAAAVEMARHLGSGSKIVTVICDGAYRYQTRLFSKKWLHSKGLYDALPQNYQKYAVLD